MSKSDQIKFNDDNNDDIIDVDAPQLNAPDLSSSTSVDDFDSFDDDAGIFAKPPVKKKTNSSIKLIFAIVALSGIGIGGYFLFNNAEQNYPVAQNLNVTDVPVDAPVVNDIAPIVEQNIQVVDLPKTNEKPLENPVIPDENAPLPENLVEPPVEQSVQPPVQTPVQNNITPVIELPPTDNAIVIAPPVNNALNLAPETHDISAAPEVKSEIVKPEVVEQKVVEQEKVEIENNDPIVVGEDAKDALPVKDEKTVFFDSPDGKMLKDIPAPSMNPIKGKGESIIIVKNDNNKKSNIKVTTTDLEPKIIAANRAMKLERFAAAEEMYNNLYAENKRDGRILMGRAVLFQKTGRIAESIAAYEELLAIDPNNAEAVVNYSGLIMHESPAVALNKLLDLKQVYPNNIAVLAQLGIVYAYTGNFTDAFSNLSHASQIDPHNPQHYFNMAVISERAKDTKRAITMYEKALEVDAMYGTGRLISRDKIYDRLSFLRGN